MTKSTKLDFINVVYVIGVVLVVLGHATSYYIGTWGEPVIHSSAVSVTLNRYIYSFHMPLFFFLSGYIFRYNITQGKYLDYRIFLKNKAQRLLIPYVLMGLLVVVPTRIILKSYTFSTGLLGDIFWDIIMGMNPSQLWYLLSLFIMFSFYFFLRKVVDRFQKNILFNLVAILSLILWTYAPMLIGGDEFLFQIDKVFSFTIYFHLGYLSSLHGWVGIKKKYQAPVWFIGHVAFSLLSLNFDFPLQGVLGAIIAIQFYITISLEIEERFSYALSTCIFRTMRDYNLEIYLFHQQIIQMLLISYDLRALPPSILVPLLTGFGIVLSVLIAKSLARMRKIFAPVIVAKLKNS